MSLARRRRTTDGSVHRIAVAAEKSERRITAVCVTAWRQLDTNRPVASRNQAVRRTIDRNIPTVQLPDSDGPDDFPDAIESYVGGLNRQVDAVVAEIESRRALPHVLARAVGAKRVLEIGTAIGYSGTWLARALPAGR